MKHKFKIGDKVRTISSKQNYSHRRVGYEFVIEEIHHDKGYPTWYREKRGVASGVAETSLELVKIKNTMAKNSKEPKINFLLQYELEEDPIEEYETEQQVKDRIKELSEISDLQEDSIVVYDVSRVRKISLKRELVIEGF